MRDVRVIKKYPNRRLYDTAISSYITLADVKNLVLNGVDFEVVDARTKVDLTRTILLQIIAEEEGGGPIFSADLLAQIIRSYGGSEQTMLTSFLEKSMQLWAEQRRLFHAQARPLVEGPPMGMPTQIAERNLAIWQAMTGVSPDADSAETKAARPERAIGKIGQRSR